MSIKNKLKFGVGMSAMFAAFAAPAFAQETVEAEESQDSRKLQTIKVTATKREQTLQDVPVAVSVVDNEVIDKAEILDLNDLQSVVPSLGFRTFQNSANANFTIRGFGNGANNVGIEPSVGVFIDGVYRSRAASQISDLPNIARVEVLRGPQSTLFGKNASAGVVSVVTQKPSDVFGGDIEVSVGSDNLQRFKGYVTGPLADKANFSLGGSYNKRDGFATNVVDGSDLNERNRWGIQGEVLLTPTENMEWRLKADFDKIDEACCVATNLINDPIIDATFTILGGEIVAENPFARQIALNGVPENLAENQGISLHGDIEFDGFTFTTITAYRETEYSNNYDIDYSSTDLASISDDLSLETFTQEVRLTSNGEGNFDWMVGGFYFDETVDLQSQLSYDSAFRGFVELLGGGAAAVEGVETLLGFPVGTIGIDGSGTMENTGQEDTSLSLFATTDWHISDRLTATLGLNYTENEKKSFLNIQSSDALASLDLVQVGYISTVSTLSAQTGIAPGAPGYDQLQQTALAIASDLSTNPLSALRGLQFQPPFLNVPNAVESGITDDDQITYTFRLAYDLTDNINIYGSYATGWKSSSINLGRDSRPFAEDFTPYIDPATGISIGPVVDPFTGDVLRTAPPSAIQDAGLAVANLTTGTRFAEPEDAEVFEIGVKGAWDTFAINLAIFDQKIENFQSNVFLGTGFVLANAEEQSATGVEVDMSWSPIDDLTLTFAGTFLDATYDSFTGGQTIGANGVQSNQVADLSGATPSGIPDVITSTSALYNFDLSDSWGGFVRADWQYEADTDFFSEGSPANDVLARYNRDINNINASIGFNSDNGLGVSIWGRNIFEHEYITTAFAGVAQDGVFSGYPSQPATYGITVSKEW